MRREKRLETYQKPGIADGRWRPGCNDTNRDERRSDNGFRIGSKLTKRMIERMKALYHEVLAEETNLERVI